MMISLGEYIILMLNLFSSLRRTVSTTIDNMYTATDAMFSAKIVCIFAAKSSTLALTLS